MIHRPERGEWPGLVLEVPARQVVNKIESLKARSPKSSEIRSFDRYRQFRMRIHQPGHTRQNAFFGNQKSARWLVQDCATNKANARICKTLIQMAHNFGSRAAAVGISTEADLKTLLEFDCDVGQGFLFGKPMTTQQIDAMIASFSGEAS